MLRLHVGGKEKKDGWKILNIQPGPDVDYVGSCTDLKATVSYPLRRLYGDNFAIAPLSVMVDPVATLEKSGLDAAVLAAVTTTNARRFLGI